MAEVLGGSHSVLDVAVLVVTADPPVAMATASRAVVVVNKVDIVGDDELAEVVAFTARALRREATRSARRPAGAG